MYELYNNILCVTADVLYEKLGVITYYAYEMKCRRGTLPKVRTASRGRQALLAFEHLCEEWRKAIVALLGDPYKVTRRNAIEELITGDEEAINFYRDYRYDDGKSLPLEKQREYAMNAQVLKVIKTLVSDRQARCKAIGGHARKIWQAISPVLNDLDKQKYPHSLPNNHRALSRAFQRWTSEGYAGLIHRNYGNSNSEKLTPEAKLWILSRWADQVNRVTGEAQLLAEYNRIAPSKGWKMLLEADTITNYLYQPDIQAMWFGHRYGELKSKEKFAFQHSTKLPTMRDSLWYSDGTKLNYFYQNDAGKVCTISVYEVMDTYSEVLLGYHISPSEDYQTQYSAFKMAVQFAGHKPYQLGFDNQGGHKKLENGTFLDKVAHLAIKAQPYNGKSKTIESAFNRFQSQYLKKDWFFTGQNIQAKKLESKHNAEFIRANKANLPTLAQIKELYKQRRDEWNNANHHATGIPRIQMYQASSNPQSPAVQMWDMVDIFWLLREKPVTYNAYGLTFTEKKEDYTYTVYGEDRLPDLEWHRKNIDRKFWIKFDPEDMTMVYLYEKDSQDQLRFVTKAETKVEIARGKQEQTNFDHQYIADVQALNTQARVAVVSEMDQILEQHGMSAEQYGLNSPAILGVNSSRKKRRKASDIGKVLKEESEIMPVVAYGKDDEEEFNRYNAM